MHTIEPARLKPGVDPTRLPVAAAATPPATAHADRRDHGPGADLLGSESLPGTRLAKKLDAIDTDQITPAADCVSESLDTLDERWKAGSFRYLMPDFRARVHRGETFLIAGDRFAIGSSREMSPAGLKGVAEEAGLEMVVVCGHNMGDIFRRNAFNLGLHVVQCPEAVADARDGDEFSFDPRHAAAAQRDAGQGPTRRCRCPPKEEEIRRSGGIFAVGRREFKPSVRRTPSIDWPRPALRATDDDDRADRLGAPRRQGSAAAGVPARARRCASTPICCRRPTAPRRSAIHTFNQITGGHTIYPRQAAIANDHFVFTGDDDDDKQTSIGREFARAARPGEAVLRDAGRRHLSFLLSRAGAGACPASSSPAPTRTAAPTAPTAPSASASDRRRSASAGRPATSTSRSRRQRRVVFRGRLQPWVGGKDIVLELLRRWGAKQSQGMSVEFVDARPAAADGLPQHDRQHDGGGRGAERHLRARRDHATRGTGRRA